MEHNRIKRTLIILLTATSLIIVIAVYNKGSELSENKMPLITDSTSNKMNITIESKTFSATLYDNETVTAFKAMLPLSLDMKELNGNEKYYRFSTSLPSNASNPGTINTGDLMLWDSNSLVLFYQTFTTQYSYIRLGKIDDPSGLVEAVGSGSIRITFELE